MALSLARLRERLGGARPADGVEPVRPPGPLLWVHLGAGVDPLGIELVLNDLRDRHPTLALLGTGGAGAPPPPPDRSGPVRRFLDRWAPDVILWTGADAFPTLWSEALARNIAQAAAEIDTVPHRLALVRDLHRFDAVFPLRADPRLGIPEMPSGRLSTVPSPPGADPDDVEEMARSLSNRPVWLALDVPDAEIPTVLDAHAVASRLTHRLLLVLVPERVETAREALFGGGWLWSARDEVGTPEPSDQVFLACDAAERGLWLRIAPITYLGGSLAGPGPASSPYAPASLGSATVHGPAVAGHERAVTRLHRGRAALRIEGAGQLAAAVEELLNPDRAAQIAHDAWAVTSDGAEVSARLLETLDDLVDGIALR
ncbi:hypothetical protein E2L08_12035 [Palleronia sediminis]|uniref:3-deoxy-D-manno-octulosonic acid transferase n=1 Tax=Palleronia sediminis TaxID=2547833 RepID=A0A4R6AAC9_9RHOB|nr:hypothetical protein [Palleronia sediminis]TDL78216.1 hypothetical protein E2L08_12035 [Palleronia sediminis]